MCMGVKFTRAGSMDRVWHPRNGKTLKIAPPVAVGWSHSTVPEALELHDVVKHDALQRGTLR